MARHLTGVRWSINQPNYALLVDQGENHLAEVRKTESGWFYGYGLAYDEERNEHWLNSGFSLSRSRAMQEIEEFFS